MEFDLNFVRSVVTAIGLTLFLGLVAWTWWPRRKLAYESAAQLPFDGEPNIDSGATR